MYPGHSSSVYAFDRMDVSYGTSTDSVDVCAGIIAISIGEAAIARICINIQYSVIWNGLQISRLCIR